MSVQSRRKPSKLFTATICGFIWVFALWFAFSTVQGTLEEIRNQAVEGTAGYYNRLYLVTLLLPVPRVLWRVRCIDDLKIQDLALQLFYFILFAGVFKTVLRVASEGAKAFFLGNPEPGVFSTYEALYILLLCGLGLALLPSSVMNDKHRNEIRIGVGGILFTIGIFLPNMLSSFALLKATCTSPLPEGIFIKVQCQEQAIGTIPMFTMAIAFSAALAVLFFFTLLSPEVARFISRLTGDGTNARESGSLSDSLESAQTQQNLPGQELETSVRHSSAESLPPVAQRHHPCGSFAAAVFGGVVLWAIQAIGERTTKHR